MNVAIEILEDLVSSMAADMDSDPRLEKRLREALDALKDERRMNA